jgi:hypothetical protein
MSHALAALLTAGATLWADEPIYFLTRRVPPSGMEFAYSHKLDLPDAALKRQVAAGVFSCIETCENDETIESMHLPRPYAQKAEVAGCTVFRDPVHD